MAAVRIIGALPRDGRGNMCGSQVHHLPCRIKHDGPAKVDTYFLPTELGDGKLEAAFRGRRLEGTVVDLAAAGAVGVVFRETTAPTEAAMLPNEAGASSAAAPEVAAKGEPAVLAAAPPQARPAVQKKPARGRGGYGGGGGGYGFGGGGAVSDEDGDGDDDDDEDEQYALDFGGDDDVEAEAAARPASSSSTLLGGAMRSAGASSSSSAAAAASGAEEFGRCWMRTWEVDRAFDSATYW